jgi:hypothetical protein
LNFWGALFFTRIWYPLGKNSNEFLIAKNRGKGPEPLPLKIGLLKRPRRGKTIAGEKKTRAKNIPWLGDFSGLGDCPGSKIFAGEKK